ncbi:hypothetical protein [Novipirellula herctigrandis]
MARLKILVVIVYSDRPTSEQSLGTCQRIRWAKLSGGAYFAFVMGGDGT